jgi:hypothetical protein
MSSNGGSQAATLATLVRVSSVDLTTEDVVAIVRYVWKWWHAT